MANSKKGGKKGEKSPARTTTDGLNTLNQRKITHSFQSKYGHEAKNKEEEIEFSQDKDLEEDAGEEESTKGNETNEARSEYEQTDQAMNQVNRTLPPGGAGRPLSKA